jgi:glutamate racemase
MVKMQYKPIGIFDSGVGGISVLREAIKLLPNENFIYYGDSKNAPYGIKTVDEVKNLSFSVTDILINKGIKALVVACNTATSAAINDLREKYKIPIIGIEPALKPAVLLGRKGKILIMATPMTLSEEKFYKLMKKYEDIAEIVPMPCPGLVELIEDGTFSGEKINSYLKEKLSSYIEYGIAAIVLGCTHYPFVKKEIKLLTKDVPIIDGSKGTARQLKKKLVAIHLLNDSGKNGNVELHNSMEDSKMLDISNKLLKMEL